MTSATRPPRQPDRYEIFDMDTNVTVWRGRSPPRALAMCQSLNRIASRPDIGLGEPYAVWDTIEERIL